MKNNNVLSPKQTVFIDYILSNLRAGRTKLPAISQIGKELGISTPNLREQMELAKNLGIISIQPRVGISINPYDFAPAVSKSLYYAVHSDPAFYAQYSDLRNTIEKSYFIEAAQQLSRKDIEHLLAIVESAKAKLDGAPIQIPHDEHRTFHLKIYKKLQNVFIEGLLESYWDMYELEGLNTYTDLTYLQHVWKYHEEIIQAVEAGNMEHAYELLEKHIELLYERE